MSKFVFHSDPGHGWLQVPKKLIRELGIGKEISSYSYQDEDFLYLEEDCDAVLFIEAYVKKEEDCDAVLFIEAYVKKNGAKPEFVVKHYNDECFVRALRGA